ncbi:hypothetical protein ACJ5NV_08440 [Loktanella agnita]|uniref:hypothetical protein n=1 Tax=Loktanella agnita TaxID=287097 RepID=UPI0039887DF5
MEQAEVIQLTLRADYIRGLSTIIAFLGVCLGLAYLLPDTNRQTMTWGGIKDAFGLSRLPDPLFALALTIWSLFLTILLIGLLWIVISTAFGAM